MSGNQLIAILSPTIGAIFTIFLLPLWLSNRSRSYVLYFIGTFALYTLAAASQLRFVAGDTGPIAPLTPFFYLACVILLAEGCLKRVGRRLNYPLTAIVAAAVFIGVCYYFYIDRNVAARIYVVSTGCGTILVNAAYRLRPSRSDSLITKTIFWIFVIMSMQILLRPLVIGNPWSPTVDTGALRTSSFWLTFNFSLIISAVFIGLSLLAAIVLDMTADLKQQNVVDALTGVYNRRGFDEEASLALGRASAQPVSLVLCDIDHFKNINDTHGHPRGDGVIKELASLLTAHAGKNAVVGRIGGEEFAILLTRSTVGEARAFAESVRALFEASGQAAFHGSQMTTASFGIAAHRPGENLQPLMDRADELLYDAKKAGRNRICAEDGVIAFRASA